MNVEIPCAISFFSSSSLVQLYRIQHTLMMQCTILTLSKILDMSPEAPIKNHFLFLTVYSFFFCFPTALMDAIPSNV